MSIKTIKIVLIWAIIIVMAISFFLWVSSIGRENQRIEQEWFDQEKLLKEMSIDKVTTPKTSGWFFLIAGSVYATVDEARVVSMVYGQPDSGDYVYKTLTLPLDNIEVVTIPNGTAPYLKVRNRLCCQSFDKYHTLEEEIVKVRLYLPEGWVLIKNV